MHLQLIRNATLRLSYAGQTLLIDPWLAPRHAVRSFGGRSRNPTVDLLMPVDAVLGGVDLTLVSHLHPDHFDTDPVRLPLDGPLLAPPAEAAALRTLGFTDVLTLEDAVTWRGLHITRTPGAHGTGTARAAMGEVSGFVFRADGEPTVYWAGDTIWNDDVARTIEQHAPDVIVVHAAGAQYEGTLIIMDAEQALAVCAAAPRAVVVATHLEAVDHATVTRADLRAAAARAGLADRLLVPEDGETLSLPAQAVTG
ncbi:MBL fold metallo-hydrolase [Deinococcus maricopensis]|uniref:Putative Zn-dependent hydrolase of the beta-lactamase fold protein n=1 Tax=Deinococcus maricopensis (strain DSM 21211 / LMG 22137 / NRRL B-23946 / LB-34) TaxID=709986 RepID=E8U7A5_DEIML|nr:MBL fold metallo-hydrolase [Deinococcus maricopensis]ADV66944.1 putative Zn-dependent hydrolase of the beta-lactamase fold protein [Deinococcus maricopensis DSM 21211]